MKEGVKKSISLILVLTLLVQLLPVVAFGVGDETNDLDISTDSETVSMKDDDAEIVGEEDALREESVKHFRLRDGGYMLVEYETAVHYQTADGSWEEIDNTLQKTGQQYVAKAGDMTRKFAASLDSGFLFETAYQGCLPLLIQFPILFALYRVIWNVPAYVAGVKEAMMGLVNAIMGVSGAQELLTDMATKNQISFDKLGFNAESIVDTLYKLKPADWTTLAEKFPSLTDNITSTQAHLDKMNYFFGLNISDSPLNVLTSALESKSWLLVIGALAIPIL